MSDRRAAHSTHHKNNWRVEIVVASVLSFILLSPLFTLPGPLYSVNQPFKVELLISLFVLVILAYYHLRSEVKTTSPALPDRLLRLIAAVVGAFILWSAISIIWARFPVPVLHHTLLWVLYLTTLVLFVRHLETARNIRIIAWTFGSVAALLGGLIIFDYLSAPDFGAAEPVLRVKYAKYGELLATLLPVLCAIAIYAKSRGKSLLAFAAGGLGWIAVMLSLSKGALISGVVGFTIFFVGAIFYCPPGFRKRILLAAAAWLFLTVGIQVIFSATSLAPTTTELITGSSDQTRLSTTMRIFYWKVGAQMAADHWLVGVGGDNFGLEFNESRARYHATHPSDLSLEMAEDLLAERAHNEPLQIFAELGIVGLILIVAPLTILGFFFIQRLRQGRRRMSPMLWASVAGIISFLVSSEFSSFSFRAAQNGAVFTIVLAIAVYELSKGRISVKQEAVGLNIPRWFLRLGAICAGLLAAFCVTKVYAEYETYQAQRTESYAESQLHYRRAVTADPNYANAYFSNASRASSEDEPVKAATLLRKAIDNGFGTTPTYHLLAKEQLRFGDLGSADKTYAEAVRIFPRSIMMRVEYAVFLEMQNRHAAAAEQMEAARNVDPRQAAGWSNLIKNGSVSAFNAAQNDRSIALPTELAPENAVFMFLDKDPEKSTP